MRIIELFAGIGACSKALENIGINLEIVDAVEIDKYAIASFNAVHNTNFEPQDIRNYNKTFENIDLITHGSPCQDFSIAGKQAGGDEGSGTRSSLLYETLRIVEKIKPKYILWENVKNILSKKHRHNFEKYIEVLNTLGYNSYYEVLNSKDYGVPQNRERVFTVSILKNIDNGSFNFPNKEELKIRLKDILENNVDEKYYLSKKMINFFYKNEQKQKEKGNGFRFGVSDGNVIAKAVTTRAGSRMDDNFIKCIQVAQIYGTEKEPNPQAGRIYDSEGISPTMDTCSGGNRMPKIIVGSTQKHAAISKDGIVPTLTSAMGQGGGHVPMHNYDLRIRKLTPLECWRLMGFNDEDFEKAKNIPTSNTQLYKQAGNSIVVKVLEKIFKNLLNINEKIITIDTLQAHNGISFNELLNRITLGDSYKLIKQIPDGSIDLVIVDPPYEITTGVHSSGFLKNRKELESTKQIFEKKLDVGINNEILNQLNRVMKRTNIYIWCNKKQLYQYLDFYKSKNIQLEIIIWNKYNCIPLTNNTYLPDKEFCLYFKEKGICLNTSYDTAKTVYNIPINISDKKKFKHPTIKPLQIIKNLIINSSKEGDIVLDCFSGSGTTCVAAKELNRQYIGIEIDPEYHKISIDRLQGILANGQTSMFMS